MSKNQEPNRESSNEILGKRKGKTRTSRRDKKRIFKQVIEIEGEKTKGESSQNLRMTRNWNKLRQKARAREIEEEI